jgi:hypothetical protein
MPKKSPVAVIESLIYWNTDVGTCQECSQQKQKLSVMELYMPLDLFSLLILGEGEEATYAAISGIASFAMTQAKDAFRVDQTRLLCETCLESAFAGFTKKDAYQITRRGVEQQAKQQKVIWTAIFYCLLVGGETREEMVYKSQANHFALGGAGFRPPLHDVLTMGWQAVGEFLPK